MTVFDPSTFPFEVLGFFEEFLDAETHKFLGVRSIEFPDRPVGAAGWKNYTLTSPLDLVKGYKKAPVTVRASKTKPRKVIGMIQVLCGRQRKK